MLILASARSYSKLTYSGQTLNKLAAQVLSNCDISQRADLNIGSI